MTPARKKMDTPLDVISLRHVSGARLRVLTLGATVLSLDTPDRDGRLGDIVLGYRDLEAYRNNTQYFGALVGRYANRIAHGRCVVDGRDVTLTVNNHGHTLHGGVRGWNQAMWHAERFDRDDVSGVVASGDGVRVGADAELLFADRWRPPGARMCRRTVRAM